MRFPSVPDLVCLFFLSGALTLCGCGGGNKAPPTIPVGGTVTFKGTPLTNGKVRFNPGDPKKQQPAEGTIGTDGRFTMSTFKPGDGVMAGDYQISVTSISAGTEKLAKDKGLGIGGKSAIPEKYADAKTSGLKETIKAGEPKTNLTLDLKE